MRTTLCAFVMAGVLLTSGCSSGDPVALAKEFAAAMKSGDLKKIEDVGRQVERLSEADQQKFGEAYLKEMFAGMGAGGNPFGGLGGGNGFVGDMGGMMKGMPKLDMPKLDFDFPKFDQPKFDFPKFDQPKFDFPK